MRVADISRKYDVSWCMIRDIRDKNISRSLIQENQYRKIPHIDEDTVQRLSKR